MKLGMTVTGRFGTKDLSVPFHHGLFSLHCSFEGYIPDIPGHCGVAPHLERGYGRWLVV